VNVKEKNT